jgi:hypothetical protein
MRLKTESYICPLRSFARIRGRIKGQVHSVVLQPRSNFWLQGENRASDHLKSSRSRHRLSIVSQMQGSCPMSSWSRYAVKLRCVRAPVWSPILFHPLIQDCSLALLSAFSNWKLIIRRQFLHKRTCLQRMKLLEIYLLYTITVLMHTFVFYINNFGPSPKIASMEPVLLSLSCITETLNRQQRKCLCHWCSFRFVAQRIFLHHPSQ